MNVDTGREYEQGPFSWHPRNQLYLKAKFLGPRSTFARLGGETASLLLPSTILPYSHPTPILPPSSKSAERVESERVNGGDRECIRGESYIQRMREKGEGERGTGERGRERA